MSESAQKLSLDQLYDQAIAAVEEQRKTAIREHPGPSNHLTRYYFGVRKNKNHYSKFICKSSELIPENMVAIRFKILKPTDVEKEANEFYEKYIAENHIPEQVVKNTISEKIIDAGEVVYFVDGQKIHTSIVIEYNKEYSRLLFITSNPYWNPWSRPISGDEETLLGYPSRGKTSYLAPVIRPSKFIKRSGCSFPSHRIDSLMMEFPEEKFIDR